MTWEQWKQFLRLPLHEQQSIVDRVMPGAFLATGACRAGHRENYEARASKLYEFLKQSPRFSVPFISELDRVLEKRRQAEKSAREWRKNRRKFK